MYQFNCEFGVPIRSFAFCITVLNCKILAFNPIKLDHLFSKSIQNLRAARSRAIVQIADPNTFPLLLRLGG